MRQEIKFFDEYNDKDANMVRPEEENLSVRCVLLLLLLTYGGAVEFVGGAVAALVEDAAVVLISVVDREGRVR